MPFCAKRSGSEEANRKVARLEAIVKSLLTKALGSYSTIITLPDRREVGYVTTVT
jgi:hypothetical protein